MGKPKVDGLLLSEYRKHVADSTDPCGCGCHIEGPDRGCDVGYSLWMAGTRNRDPVRQDAMLALMR